MAFKINGSDVIGAARSYASTANVSVTDSIIIANNDSLDAVSGSAAGYTFSDGTVVIGEDGLALNDITLRDASIEVTGPLFQGTISGYASGGGDGPPAGLTIEKFSFTSDGNATDVGDLTVQRGYASGQSSSVSGYTSGGLAGGALNTIDTCPFASNANATDVGDLTQARRSIGGGGQTSTVSGYTSGGFVPAAVNTIDKFPFAVNANATDVGDLTVGRYNIAGQSSTEYGYTAGGSPSNIIDKFPFAADGNATDVGDLSIGKLGPAGQSSTVSGYTSGSFPGSNVIDKFPFASNANATDVGDLSQARGSNAGQSSTTNGYTSGGTYQFLPTAVKNTIDKFPFAADANATDVGDLTVTRSSPTGQQV